MSDAVVGNNTNLVILPTTAFDILV